MQTSKMTENSADKDSPTNYEKLIDEVKEKFTTHLTELIRTLFNGIDEKLFEFADNAESNEDQSRYFDLMREIRLSKDQISTDYIAKLEHNLIPAEDIKAEKEREHDEQEFELSLVEQDDMEDKVLVMTISEKANGHFSEAISHLEARFEHLHLQAKNVFEKEAMSPENIIQAFSDVISEHNFSPANKQTLFDFFRDGIAYKLDTVYDAINVTMIDAGVLPQIKLHSMPQDRRSRRTADEPPTEEGMPQDQMPGNEQAMQGGQYSPPGAVTARPGMWSSGGGARPPGAPAPVSVLPGGSATAGPPGGGVAGYPSADVSEIISQYIGTGSADTPMGGEAGSGSYPQTTASFYGHQDVLSALTIMQAQAQSAESAELSPAELKFDSNAIKQALLSTMGGQHGGMMTKRINQIAEKTIDFIELIFDAIIEDEDISDTVKALLLRLQIPVIKASMLDKEFFITDDHPARVLLDKLAEVGVGVIDHSDSVYKRLEFIVQRLLSEFELETETFQVALDSVREYIEDLSEVALKKEEEEQQQVLREHARRTVLAELRAETTGNELPEKIHPLVLKRWPTLMFNHYIEMGKENDGWVVLIDMLREIIGSVQPLVDKHRAARLRRQRSEIVEMVRDKLYDSRQPRADIDKVLEGLAYTHNELLEKSGYSEDVIDQAQKQYEDDTPENELDEDIAEVNRIEIAEKVAEEKSIVQSKLESLPTEIQPGMWFEVFNGEGRAVRRLKLSVIIVEDEILIFVDHTGERVIEKDIEDFANELEEGLSKVIMHHSVFDHALNSVITTLKSPT